MSEAPTVVVFDYGSGNVHSAVTALEAAGARASLSRNPAEVLEADGLVVPGVGAFESVARALRDAHGDTLIERRLAGGRKVLGICVGMQVMFDKGHEGTTVSPGFGQWPGTVVRLDVDRLPHMGWNTVETPAATQLFRGIEHERFYFVHSYAATEWTLTGRTPATAPRVTWAEHGQRFVAAVENGPLTATQFHPEKSGAAGIALLRNWLNTL